MAIYTINTTDLSDFGISISKFTGFEKTPERKGKTEHDIPEQNGVEPFVDSSDIRFKARDLILTGHLTADTIEDAQSQFLDFQDWIYQDGELIFFVDYLIRTFIVYVKDPPIAKRIGDVSGKVTYQLDIKLREINPANIGVLEIIYLVDSDNAQFVDSDGAEFYTYNI